MCYPVAYSFLYVLPYCIQFALCVTLLQTNLTCGEGNVYVTTRTIEPGSSVADFKEFVTQPDYSYVAIHDTDNKFIYVDFSRVSSVTCTAIFEAVNGDQRKNKLVLKDY